MTEGRTIYSRFEETAAAHADKTALIYLGERYTYRFLRETAERMHAAFQHLGVQTGDRVMIYTPNCPQWVTWIIEFR